MGICFLEKNCYRISEISCLPSLKAKLLFPVLDGIPCIGRDSDKCPMPIL